MQISITALPQKVSIIIPIFNTEKYIEECIYSAISQDYENTEIIAVNDGSTDNSKEILERIQEKHKSLIILTTENRGQSAARNTGLSLATGDLAIFLDSDDSLEKNAISTCVRKLHEYDTDIVLFEALAYCDGTPEILAKDFRYERDKSIHNRRLNSQDYFKESIDKKCFIVSPCLYLYKRKKLSNIKFLEGILHEDNLFSTRLLIEPSDCNIVCIPDRLFRRRIRAGSIMTQVKHTKHVSGYLSVAKELLLLEPYALSNATLIALHQFIQIILRSAISSYNELPPSNQDLNIRKETFRILKKIPIQRIQIKTLLACLAPELLAINKQDAMRNKIK